MALDRNLLSKIAELNEQGFTQYQIASKLSKSQSTISRHLKILSRKRTKSSYSQEAEERDIKQAAIELCERYDSLKDAKVFKFKELEEPTSLTYHKALGDCAAGYIDSNVLANNQRILLGGGKTVFCTANALMERRLDVNIEPIMMIRGMGLDEGKIPPWVNAISMATKYWILQKWEQAIPQYLDEMDGEDLAQKIFEMKEKPSIKDAIERISDPDVVLFSAGPLHKLSALSKLAEKIGIEYYELEKKGVVGAICHTLIDKDGNAFKDKNLHEMTITIPLDRLKELSKDKKRHIVLIAGGIFKYEIIKTVIDAGYCNVLITDDSTAQWLIDEKNK